MLGYLRDISEPGLADLLASTGLIQGYDNIRFLGRKVRGRIIECDMAVLANAKESDIKSIADGRVWTGQQALPMKLVDEIGDFRAAIDDTAKAVGIKGEPNVVRARKEKRSLLDLLFGDANDLLPDPAKVMEKHPGFYFLWK